ncbi:MAG: hypothetical protein AABW99_00765 [archaeon]
MFFIKEIHGETIKQVFFIFVAAVFFSYLKSFFGILDFSGLNFFAIGYYYYAPKRMKPREIRKELLKNESPKLSIVDRGLVQYLRLRPSLKWMLRHPIKSARNNTILCAETKDEFVNAIADSAQKKLKEKGRVVIDIGGLRGAGKSTSIFDLKKKLGGNVADIGLDAYFKEPLEIREKGVFGAVGGWDNPRNSNLRQVSKAILDFKAGKKIYIPVGRVPRHGDVQWQEIDPSKTPVLVVEGIHGLYPSISKAADVRCFIYVPPGLQEIRTWMRDLLRPKAKAMPPEYYLGMNPRVRQMQTLFILPRLIDVDILYQQNMGRPDLEAIGRMLDIGPKELDEFEKAWKLTPQP